MWEWIMSAWSRERWNMKVNTKPAEMLVLMKFKPGSQEETTSQ
jgi:hypothetical protein